ncbi:hypothetical protein ACWERV_27145 [Streptomyces sp. NPDC004031]
MVDFTLPMTCTVKTREGQHVEPVPSTREADLLRVVEQAMRYRAVWEEVSTTHWARPFEEAKDALQAAAQRWGVSIDDTTAAKAAWQIHGGSWE